MRKVSCLGQPRFLALLAVLSTGTLLSAAGAPVTDDFNVASLNTSLWTLANPVGDGSSSMTGTQLKLNVPAGTNHDPAFGGADNSVRVVQSIANADFQVTVKFDSIPTQQYQFEGLLVEQDAANYLRFQFGSTGSALYATASQILAHNETSVVENVITLPGGTASVWLRIQKTGTTWTETWSPDGVTFTTAGSFTSTLSAADIGPFAANYNPASAPAFAALVDSFVSGTSPGVPDLTITKSHTGNFTPGQVGAAYTLTVKNSGTAATTGTVTVTDAVPTGLTATSIAGTGWTCTQPAGSCTRSDVLAAAAGYPALTLTVNVAANAAATVTNTATVSGGGETNTSNSAASDATTVAAASGPPATDNFNLSALNTSLWTFVNPAGDGSFSMTGTQLKLNVPAGPNHDAALNGVDNAPRVVQNIANSDFTATVKFDSIPTQQYQFQGIVVDQDAANFLRFQFGSGGSFLGISADSVLSHTENGLFSNTITLPGGTTSLWLRVQRAGNIWTVTWSPDGTTFNLGGTFTQALTVADLALFAGNYSGTSAPAFSALVDSFVSGTAAAAPDLTITKSHTGNFTQGQVGATYTITVTNSGNAATSGTVTVADTLPTGLTATAIAGTGWTCTQPGGSCTRTDALAAAASYPALTLTVNVAANAPATVTNTATVSGGGETNTSNNTASNPTTIGTAATPDLTISKTHTGNFALGQTGATYAITVTNSGTAPTSGTVTVADALPAGLTATSIAGTGWTCTQPAGSCTRIDALAAAGSYPALTLTVNVAGNAPATVTNTATVSGGGETNTANDTASDATTIGSAAAGPPVTDNFNVSSLNTSVWTFVNPVGDGSFSMTGTQLRLSVPAGPNHDAALNGVDSAPRVMQTIANADFTVTTKFDSIPSQQYQFQGIVVDQDAANFLRFQFGSGGSFLGISADSVLSNTENGLFSNTITLPGGTTSLWLRVQRTGNTWTVTWSPDGTTFNTGGTFTQALTVAAIGPFAGNYGATSAPAFAALVDSFVSGTVAAAPDLTITKSHTGNFTLGQTGATYTLTVKNSGNAATSGTVTVTDTVPSGLTATAIAGTGWTCTQPAGSCTRTDALAAAASYPALTLTVNVAANASATVTNTAAVSGGGETNTANNTASDATTIGSGAAGAPVTDNFNISTLNAGLWTFVNPVGDGSFSMTGTQLKLNVPAGANHDPAFGGTNSSVRAVQSIANGDFLATVKFDSIPTQQYQFEGVLVDQDAANYLRFQFGSAGTALYVTASQILSHNETTVIDNQITIPGGTTSLWLRIQRTGNTWTETWSPDGANFTPAGSFTLALTASDIGPFAGNYNPTSAPAFSALVDSFISGAAPAAPVLTISKSHTGNFTPGQTGAVYTLKVTNSGTGSTSGTVTVTDTLPTGLTATSIAGTGWICTQPAGSCTRSDVLAAAASYPTLALTVNVATNAPATVTNTATVSGGGAPNNSASDPATVGVSADPASDDFRSISLNTGLWTYIDPLGGSYSLTGTNLLINVQGGVSHDPLANDGNYSSRVMQSMRNVDFSAEIKFDSIPTLAGTLEGVLVQQDASNFLRFEFQGSGAGTNLFVGRVIGNSPSTILNSGITVSGPSLWMRIARTGNTWTLTWSRDGATYQSATSFSQAMAVSAIGPMVGNFGNSGRQTPDFTASIDYFFNLASPIVPQDGGSPRISNVSAIGGAASASITWNTDVNANSRVDYGLTTSYGGTSSNPALGLTHTILLTGLTCASTYNYAVTSVDAGANSRQSSNFTFTTPPCAGATAPRSDSFDLSSLNTAIWTFLDPKGDSYLAFNGTTAQITVAAESVHDAWAASGNASARIVQPVLDTNFDVAAKFVSDVNWATTSQGIIVEQDALNYLLFEFRYNGTTTNIWAGWRSGGTQNVLLNTPINGHAPLWLRVARSGTAWTVSWSKDGTTYTPAGTVQQSLVAASLGLYAVNKANTPLGTPAFTASVDAFVNIASPLSNKAAPPPFPRIVIDSDPGTVLVQETMGDLDGDGKPDAIVGFSDQNHGIAWYRSPHTGVLTDKWDRFVITASGESYEDMIVYDVNGDGAKDVIASIDAAVKWYENPAGHSGNPTTDVWQVHIISANAPGENNFFLKDIDGDGLIDLATPHTVYMGTGTDFVQAVNYNPAGFRGMALFDIGSGKGAINFVGTDPNVPFSFVWFENPRESGGNARTGQWIEHVVGASYPCDDAPSCFGGGSVANMATGDINGDGRMDLVTVQSEGYPVIPPGGIIWWEAPADRRNGTWIKHTFDPGFDSPHNVWVADIDKNGTLDVIAAQQEQSKQRRIAVFLNDGTGNFTMQIVSNTGSHNPFLVDINGDGWLDLFSAGHGRFGSPDPAELYINPRGGFALP